MWIEYATKILGTAMGIHVQFTVATSGVRLMEITALIGKQRGVISWVIEMPMARTLSCARNAAAVSPTRQAVTHDFPNGRIEK